MGAELFFFPTAIGSEPPPAPPVNSRDHWQRTQQGHAAANLTPLIAANRYGLERSLQNPQELYIRFYGSSFIADAMGAKVSEAGEEGDAVLTHAFDLEAHPRSCATTGSCSATAARSCTARCIHSTARAAEASQRVRAARVRPPFPGAFNQRRERGSATPQPAELSSAFPARRAGNSCSGGGGGTVSSVAFDTAWTMPSSVRLRPTDAERVIRFIATSRILVPAPGG